MVQIGQKSDSVGYASGLDIEHRRLCIRQSKADCNIPQYSGMAEDPDTASISGIGSRQLKMPRVTGAVCVEMRSVVYTDPMRQEPDVLQLPASGLPRSRQAAPLYLRLPVRTEAS